MNQDHSHRNVSRRSILRTGLAGTGAAVLAAVGAPPAAHASAPAAPAAPATMSRAAASAARSAHVVVPASITAESPPVSAANVDAALAQLDRLVEDGLGRTGVPGAAVAVVYNDAVVYERGFGVRALGQPEPVTPDTVFQIASMSKAISSTLMAALVGDGVADWDAPIASLDPGFALADPIASDQCAVRDMFCHRSGLPAYAGDQLFSTFGYGRDETMRRLRFVPPAAPLRAAFAYENTGLAAAAFAAARATGQAWEDVAQARLFAPLGMASTSYRLADYLGRADRAAPHYRTADRVWLPGEVTNFTAVTPAGGVSTNVRDLSRWMRLQLADGRFDGREVVAAAQLAEIHRPHILEAPENALTGQTTFYCLGWMALYGGNIGPLLSHGGDFSAGFRTGLYLLPSAGLGIVMLTNGWPNPLREAIPRTFLETAVLGAPTKDWVGEIDALQDQALAQTYVAPFPQGAPPADASAALPPAAYAGTYANELYGPVQVREAGGALELALGDNPARYALRHWDRDTFSYTLSGSNSAYYAQAGVVFTVGPDRRAQSIGLPDVGADATATFARAADDA